MVLRQTNGYSEGAIFSPVEVLDVQDNSTLLFRVVPPEEESSARRGKEPDLVLQPGYGWGDGTHPSTYLCLQFVHEEVTRRAAEGGASDGVSVLDYGTGSGVLALLAARCGAGRVVGVDIDDETLDHARSNWERQGGSSEMQFIHGREILPGASGVYIADDFASRTFSVVVANMLPNALLKLAATVSTAVAEGGTLALAGVTASDVPEVCAVYARNGIEIDPALTRRRSGAAPGWREELSDGTSMDHPASDWMPWELLIGRRKNLSPEEKQAYIAALSDAAVAYTESQ